MKWQLRQTSGLQEENGNKKAALPVLGFDPENTESTCPRRPGKAVSKWIAAKKNNDSITR